MDNKDRLKDLTEVIEGLPESVASNAVSLLDRLLADFQAGDLPVSD